MPCRFLLRCTSPLALAGLMAVAPAVLAESTPATTTTPATPTAPTAAVPAPTDAPPAVPAPATAAVSSTRDIVLELGKRQISLRENGRVLHTWPVAIGDPRTPTPTGRFQVENKVVNPMYQSTKSGKINRKVGPQGPLGDRWIGFKQSGANQFGIHGTPDAWAWTVTSRAAVSNGCVRMLTPHVRKLFELVEVGTPVIVQR